MGANWFGSRNKKLSKKMKNYICPNYCHINSSSTKERCPHCGSCMLDAGQDSEENREFLKKEAADRQLAYKDKFSSHQIV